jgi:DNA-binding beta-propeller fold protein YncE
VADQHHRRIFQYDLSGNYIKSFGAGVLSGPEGMTAVGADALLIADKNRVLKFQLSRELWTTVSDLNTYAKKLSHLAYSPNGEIYVTDFDLNKVFILSQMSSLYTGLEVRVERVVSRDFPDIVVEVAVEDRMGRPVVGLQNENFILSEGFRPVGELSLARANTDSGPLEIVLLVEKSPQMASYELELTEAVDLLYSQIENTGAVQVVSAGFSPQAEAQSGSSRLETVRGAVDKMEGSWDWRFDEGLRLAASELIPSLQRKAIIFLGTGKLTRKSFDSHSLAELAQYLRNNFISFYPILFSPDSAAGELEYLASETGGRGTGYYGVSGVGDILADIAQRIGPVYTLTYQSSSESDFGRNYIDLQAEVVLLRRSGRSESGYFAPLSD